MDSSIVDLVAAGLEEMSNSVSPGPWRKFHANVYVEAVLSELPLMLPTCIFSKI